MTYSIVARCATTNAFGIAITSSSICVASRCAWVGPLGAIATQNVTDPALGPAGLSLLRQGLGASAVLDLLLAGTPEPAWRQVAVIDRCGRTALHSGAKALPLAAVAEGPECCALGNLLANPEVPARMVAAFRDTPAQPLPERLMRALEAGLAAGGETSTTGPSSICAWIGTMIPSASCAISGTSTRRSKRRSWREPAHRNPRRASRANPDQSRQ
jgi:uncharacterized Ntn-hydrolase superfamily protein